MEYVDSETVFVKDVANAEFTSDKILSSFTI